jgi:hypothetical protein
LKSDNGRVCAFWQISGNFWSNNREPSFDLVVESSRKDGSDKEEATLKAGRNLIYFGPPGTGKSHRANVEIENSGADSIKTLFHPDYNYGDFFGTYRPVVGCNPSSANFKNLEGQEGLPMPVNYFEFVPGPFMKAIANSLQDKTKPHYLLIDEINRGDCSAIFGDIFQLLDRKDNGSSEYGVELRPEAADWLGKKVANWDEAEKGKLILPRNLFIFGTMNTSDQNLYPMDTAFKRRWEWESCSVEAEYKEFKGKFNNAFLNDSKKKWDWLALIKKLNGTIINESNMEDKQIGPWFLKPKVNGEVCSKAFSNKLLFYLWFDVFKDEQNSPNSPFDLNDDILTFGQLQMEFDNNGLQAIFKEDLLRDCHSNSSVTVSEKLILDLHPKTDRGEEIDATFAVGAGAGEFYLILNSHSGNGPNKKYNDGLDVLLSRLGNLSAVVNRITLDAIPGKNFKHADKSIDEITHKVEGHEYPIVLKEIEDYSDLRLRICKASRKNQQSPGVDDDSPHQKTIKIILNALPAGKTFSLKELSDYLVTGKLNSFEQSESGQFSSRN